MHQGQLNGFVLGEIVPGSLYEKIGLKNGGILRKANGISIAGALQAMLL